jgi:hypothetical protein
VNANNFFAELKRRNVYKVAIAYAVVAWLLMQIATQVFPFLEIPNWAIRLELGRRALGSTHGFAHSRLPDPARRSSAKSHRHNPSWYG